MKTFQFKNKDNIPTFGLGTWQSKRGDVYNAVMDDGCYTQESIWEK